EGRRARESVLRTEGIRRIEDVDASTSVVRTIQREDLIPSVAVEVRGGDRRAREVVFALARLVHAFGVHDEAARAVIEDLQTDLRVGVLIEGRQLVGISRPREVPDDETRALRVVLAGSGIEDAVATPIREARTRRRE